MLKIWYTIYSTGNYCINPSMKSAGILTMIKINRIPRLRKALQLPELDLGC